MIEGSKMSCGRVFEPRGRRQDGHSPVNTGIECIPENRQKIASKFRRKRESSRAIFGQAGRS